MTDRILPQHNTSSMERFFGILTDEHTYKRLGYLLASFPMGIIVFVTLVTGISLGLGLSIIWVGIPILLGILHLSVLFTMLDRSLAANLLDAEVMTPTEQPEKPQGILKQLGAMVAKPATWIGLAYNLMIKLPLGIVNFVLVVTFITVGISFIAAPLLVAVPLSDLDIALLWFDSGLSTMMESVILSMVGLILLPASLHLLSGFAWLQGQVTTALFQKSGATFKPPQ